MKNKKTKQATINFFSCGESDSWFMHPKHLRDDRAAVLVITIQCFVSSAN